MSEADEDRALVGVLGVEECQIPVLLCGALTGALVERRQRHVIRVGTSESSDICRDRIELAVRLRRPRSSRDAV